MTTHYLPDANEPALQPFTKAFVAMMFALAAFEHRVSDLMEVITGVKRFGECSENQWKVDDRPKRMKRLTKEYRRGSLPETDAIAECLKRSISFCRTRKEHLKFRPPPPRLVCKLPAIHARQSYVGKKQFDGIVG